MERTSNITITSTAGGGGGGHGRGSVGGKKRRLEQLREQLRQETTPGKKPSAPANLDANRTFAIETYGCQMNVSDSEVVRFVPRPSLACSFAHAECRR